MIPRLLGALAASVSFSAREITTQVPAGVPLRGVTTIARLQRRWLSADLQRLRVLPER